MSLAHVMMGILAGAPAHGYDLKRAYDERFLAAKPLAYGQVYATLSRLVRDRFVEAVETTQGGGPERTTYALTDAGLVALRTWLEENEQPGSYPAENLVRKTVTALHLGADATDFLRRQRESHLTLMRDLVSLQLQTREPGARISLDHTIFHLDADLQWLEAATHQMRSLREDPR